MIQGRPSFFDESVRMTRPGVASEVTHVRA